jgi:transcriptional regulator with XRE-family HTH domain
LREARIYLGISQKELAQKINVSDPVFSQIARGRYPCTAEDRKKLEKKLRLPENSLSPANASLPQDPNNQVIIQSLYKLTDAVNALTEMMQRLLEEQRLLREAVSSNYGGLTFLPEVIDLSNPVEVNSWLSAVVTGTTIASQDDLAKLYPAFSQLLSKARIDAIPYPSHSLAFKAHPYYGFYPSFSKVFMRALMLAYMIAGPRLLFMGGAGSDTWPMEVLEDLAEAITSQGDDKAKLAQLMLDIRRQYLEAFHAQAPMWMHLDICPMSAIDQLISRGEIARDDWLLYLGANALTPEHVKEWLNNVIKLLEQYKDTYHLALLDDISDPHNPVVKLIWQTFWAVKVPVNGQTMLFWEEWPADALGHRREINHHQTDGGITRAFIRSYGALWQSLPEDLLIRDKNAVIEYLEDQREKLPGSYNK